MRNTWIPTIIACGFLLCAGGANKSVAQDRPPNPDNTKVNQAERGKAQPTADQAKNSVDDRETMQKIRKAVIADKSLSTYAHNVKIISQDGKVTLKGPVRTEEEKTTIEKLAAEVVGASNVTSELTVKPTKKGT